MSAQPHRVGDGLRQGLVVERPSKVLRRQLLEALGLLLGERGDERRDDAGEELGRGLISPRIS